MEKAMDSEQKTLINIELTQGRELANQLKNHFVDNTKKSGETCEFLVEKILSSYEKALSMLKSCALMEEPLPATNMLESLHSLASVSPRSVNADQDSKDHYHKNVFKKRKTLPKCSEQIRVCLGTGVEGPLGDGYSWRKYGQKDILGARFPRAYYRCSHRHAHGCLATKKVQKSDEDPSIFEVTYSGRHTCNQAYQLTTSLVSLGKEGKKQKKEREDEIQKQAEEIIFNFGTGLKTEELGTIVEVERLPSFSFPSTPIESENVESQFFPECLRENNFMGSYSPPFISPATSESNYFSLSAPTSVTNSPIGDLDISLDQVDFDPNFPFDILEFIH